MSFIGFFANTVVTSFVLNATQTTVTSIKRTNFNIVAVVTDAISYCPPHLEKGWIASGSLYPMTRWRSVSILNASAFSTVSVINATSTTITAIILTAFFVVYIIAKLVTVPFRYTFLR